MRNLRAKHGKVLDLNNRMAYVTIFAAHNDVSSSFYDLLLINRLLNIENIKCVHYCVHKWENPTWLIQHIITD